MVDLGLCLTHNRLKVKNSEDLIKFYTDVFGIKLSSTVKNEATNEVIQFLGYGQETDIKISDKMTFLELVSPLNSNLDDKASGTAISRVNCEGKYSTYWKIGINLYDLRYAAERLKDANVKMTDPIMIPDVGLLCHVYDPEGYDTELMQYTFEGKLLDHQKHDNSTLGQDAILSVITLRVKDIEKSLKFYKDILGMKILCRQDQSATYGFDIYYLGFTEENPPNPDVKAVENIEWTYRRPYTLLELMVYTNKEENAEGYVTLNQSDYGFLGIGFGCKKIEALNQHLLHHQCAIIKTETSHEIFKTPFIDLKDPDGVPIRIVQV